MDAESQPLFNPEDAPISNKTTVIPSLSFFCVRVIGAHLSSIDSLGNMSYDIIKPILEDKRCTPDILRKFEANSPHLKEYDQEIWKKFYFEKWPERHEPYLNGEYTASSWRKLYMQSMVDQEEKLKSAAIRLRESKERGSAAKKGRQLQLTDKLPPSKRSRLGDGSWSSFPSKPKTLMEKARTQTKKATTVYRAPPPTSTSRSMFISSSASASTSSAVTRQDRSRVIAPPMRRLGPPTSTPVSPSLNETRRLSSTTPSPLKASTAPSTPSLLPPSRPLMSHSPIVTRKIRGTT